MAINGQIRPKWPFMEGKHVPWTSVLASKQIGKELVRFPNSLGCELGERRSYSLWIELPGPIVQKKLLEVARWAQNLNRQHKISESWSAKLSKIQSVRLQRGISPFLQFATSLGGQIYVKYLFLTSFVFAKSCIPDFFHDFQTDLLSIQEEMLWNSFLTSAISTCPLEYQLKKGPFLHFSHNIYRVFVVLN